MAERSTSSKGSLTSMPGSGSVIAWRTSFARLRTGGYTAYTSSRASSPWTRRLRARPAVRRGATIASPSGSARAKGPQRNRAGTSEWAIQRALNSTAPSNGMASSASAATPSSRRRALRCPASRQAAAPSTGSHSSPHNENRVACSGRAYTYRPGHGPSASPARGCPAPTAEMSRLAVALKPARTSGGTGASGNSSSKDTNRMAWV